MMRSMFSGVSSLKTHQTKMDVIAHNISNVNTVGFKSSRVTFNDVFSQTVSGASRANENTGKGGTNPMQIGLGVSVSSIDKNMSTGASQRTDRAMDLMINGDGFFIVGDASGTYFTRAGAFDKDESGFLVMGNGMRVYGWDTKTDASGNITIQKDRAQPIQIAGEKEYASPSTTKNVDFGGNLDALSIISAGKHVSSLSFYDSIGNRYVTDVTFQYTEATYDTATPPAMTIAPYWSYSISDIAYPNGDRTEGGVQIGPAAYYATGADAAAKAAALKTAGFTGTFSFDTLGDIAMINGSIADKNNSDSYLAGFTPSAANLKIKAIFGGDSSITQNITADPTAPTPPASASTTTNLVGAIRLNFKDLTQYGNYTTSAKFTTKDGNAPGTLEGLSVGSDGIITGRYSNGETKMIGQIPIATFRNPAGLEAMGNNLYTTTANSGDFDGTGIESGNMMGGVLEMSNADLSTEFTEMITTQRGFQAGSRLITTSDEMLQELVNLKR